jgi:3-hydroxyacyl-CoA dehydrogenase
MSNLVRIEREGEIGLICLTKPPVNALGVALRSAVFDAVQKLVGDAAVKAIVLYGEGRFFSAGADIKDFPRAAEKPTLPDLLKALNDSPKPTIAAMHGVAFGGALELALSTHLRVGVTGLKLGLPEVKLGLLPGAGGTQRLTRLTGIDQAVAIICTGRDVSADEALNLRILSRLEDGTARQIGLSAARDVLAETLSATPTDSLTVTPDPAALDAARKAFGGKLNAPLKAIDAIEAATLPIDEGLAHERALFMELMQSEERAGLVHAFFAERATVKIPEAKAQMREITNVGVVGGGTMGVGIATSVLLAGLPVTLIETAEDRVATARAAVEANLAGALKRGKLTDKTHKAATGNLIACADLASLSETDLVVEAIFEDMDAKTSLFGDLERICKPGAILATNTSYLDVNAIAAATTRPEDVIGLHFFSPAHIMRLLEVVVADKTAPEVTATAFDLARRLRKIPVRAGVCDGFIGNRILARYRKLSEYLVLDGADFDQVDRALESFGFAMGPFAVGDLAGLDIAKAARDRKAATRPTEERYSRVADLICDQGWFGRKTGRGYYLYEGGKKTGPNPGALDIVAAERTALGITPRDFSDDDIIERILAAMIQEAAMILQDGIALCPVDIDAVQLFGYGFPRHRGGPMHTADQIGLATLIARIEGYGEEDGTFWQVPELLRDMAAKGLSFADLNAAEARS